VIFKSGFKNRESQFNTARGSECAMTVTYSQFLLRIFQILFDTAIKEGFPFNFK